MLLNQTQEMSLGKTLDMSNIRIIENIKKKFFSGRSKSPDFPSKSPLDK